MVGKQRPSIQDESFQSQFNRPSTTSDERYGTPLSIDDMTNYNINNDNMHVDEPKGAYFQRINSVHRNNLNYNSHNMFTQAYEARTGGRNLLKGEFVKSVDYHANLIVSKIEQDASLMEDTPDSEELRRETLRDMPQNLTLKRCVKQKLTKSISQKSKHKPLGFFKMLKYRLTMAMSKFRLNLRDIAYSLELWYSPLKLIEGNFGMGVASYFKLLRWLFLLNVGVSLVALVFILLPRVFNITDEDKNNYGDFDWTDLFTGEGFFFAMYYGFYSNQTLTFYSLTYSMPHAYFFTMLTIYFISLLVLSISVAKSYSRTFIETEGGLKNIYAHKIFCGWDYNIATQDAAELKSRAIYSELRELLSATTKYKRSTPCLLMFYTRCIQIIMNFIVIILLSGTAYVMWILLVESHSNDFRSKMAVMTPIVVNIVMTVFPMLFSFIVRYEDYSPKISLYITLVRTFVLGFVTIVVLITFWLRNTSEDACWENSLAKEIYRLVIFDFIFSVIVSPITDLLAFAVNKFCFHKYLEFDIAKNTMQIIYNQTLMWVGLYFSPLLPVLVAAKLFLMWYCRELIVLKLCKPSTRTWRAATTSTWFLVMAFLSLLLVGGLIGYIISYVPVSKSCGPFTNYNQAFEIVTQGVFKLQSNSTLWKVLLYVTKPGVIALILIGLCAEAYYLRARAMAQREIVAMYRDLLMWESKDKEFLLNNISRVTKGQWQYELHDRLHLDPVNSAPDITREYGDVRPKDYSNSPYVDVTVSSMSTQASSSGTSMGDFEFDSQLYSKYKKIE